MLTEKSWIRWVFYNNSKVSLLTCLFSVPQVLATGLSGLYSSLPTKLEVPSEEWHCLHREDWLQMPSLVQFLNSLEFCNAVIQVNTCAAALPCKLMKKHSPRVSNDRDFLPDSTFDWCCPLMLTVSRWPTLISETSWLVTSIKVSSCLSSHQHSTRLVFY